ncbi:MAG: response regulator transcription factor [Bacteroidota bacterium]
MHKATILYVEDDESLSFVTRDHLELSGYRVIHCADGQQARSAIEAGTDNYDCALLDVMLPGTDGFSLAELIRKQNQDLPIIFLTARSLKEDRLHGLRLGADDYITKPFSIEELILKIEVFLRRSQVRPTEDTALVAPGEIASFAFDPDNLSLVHTPSGENRRLTRRESDLLKYLSARRNQVLERAEILLAIWGKDDYFLGRSLDVFISRLRKYLVADPAIEIENIHGVGFCFKVNG